MLGLKDCYLRHPRLYVYEELPVDPCAVTVHCTGRVQGHMPEKVLRQIELNYRGYAIYQVGLPSDLNTPFIDRRSTDFWEGVRLVAGSAIFIGLLSSFYLVAQAYPRVRRKLVLKKDDSGEPKTEEDWRTFAPFKWEQEPGWIDFNTELFNEFDRDIGVSYSYLKI